MTNKPFEKDFISEDELQNSANILKDNFFFFKIENPLTIKEILDSSKELIVDKNIKNFCIDPWICLDHQGKGSMDIEYVSQMVNELTAFAKSNDVLIHLVVHAKKPTAGEKEKISLNAITGSNNFSNLADYVIFVYRNNVTKQTEIHTLKIRDDNYGIAREIAYLHYDKLSGNYFDIAGSDLDSNFGNANSTINNSNIDYYNEESERRKGKFNYKNY